MFEPDLLGAFLLSVFLDPLAYVAGIIWCLGMSLIVVRSVKRMIANSNERR